jgi:Txe/YoeB family toxin of Txe-Axe toxin-antitoxin module
MFSTKYVLNKHIIDQICIKHQIICKTCGKIFADRSGLGYHIKNSVCKKNDKKQKVKLVLKSTYEDLLAKAAQCEELLVEAAQLEESRVKAAQLEKSRVKVAQLEKSRVKAAQLEASHAAQLEASHVAQLEAFRVAQLEAFRVKTAQLEGEIKSLKENSQTVNNNITNTNSNATKIIVPPEFLQADTYDNISRRLPNLLHEALFEHPANFITFLIKETNCNPDRPLYNSIKLTNNEDSFLQISNGKKYIYATKQSTISQLIGNKKDMLRQYVDINGDKYGQKILKKYQNYVDFLDDDKNAQKNLEVDIICMLLNISDVIGSDEWSKKLLEDLKTCDLKE